MMKAKAAERIWLRAMLAVLCAVILAFAAFPASAAADDDSFVIADFEDGRDEWIAGDNVK